MRLCILLGLPTHLMQELNVGTVPVLVGDTLYNVQCRCTGVIDVFPLITLTYVNPSNAEKSKAQERKNFGKPSEPCRVGTHLKALAEHSHMSTHLPCFSVLFRFLHHFVLAKLATSRIRVNTTLSTMLFTYLT